MPACATPAAASIATTIASSLRFMSSLLLLEMESRRELYPPWRPGGDRLAEKRRAQSADEPRVVHPIDMTLNASTPTDHAAASSPFPIRSEIPATSAGREGAEPGPWSVFRATPAGRAFVWPVR